MAFTSFRHDISNVLITVSFKALGLTISIKSSLPLFFWLEFPAKPRFSPSLKTFADGAAIKLFVQFDDVGQAVLHHAAAAGLAHRSRLFGIIHEFANGVGEFGDIADRNDHPTAPRQKVADAAGVGTNDGDFQAKRLHDAAGQTFA